MFLSVVLTFITLPGLFHCHYFEWLVPKDLHRCCGDTISNYPECKSIDAAASINGSLVLFSGHHFIQTKVRDSHFPQILHDQSVKSIKQWNFKETPQRAMAAEVEAAAHDGKNFIVKKGDTLYTFPTSAGTGNWLSCSRHNGLECKKGGRGLEAMARLHGRDRVKYFITYRQKPGVEKDGQAYDVSVKRGSKEWRTYTLNDESDTVDATAIYNVRYGVTPDNAKVVDENPSESDSINYGVYFNTHGYACFYEITGEELESKSFYKIERPAITPGVPMVDCQPLNIFFGCPQSWCFRNDVDDMIVTQTREEVGSNREVIIVYRGHYFWTASADNGIPILPASVRQQHLAMGDASEGVKSLWYIDAAEAMSVETHDFVLYFIDDKLLLYKGIFGEPEVHSSRNFEQETGIGYEKVIFRDSQIYDDLNEMFPSKECRMVDTLWYNKFDGVLYLFCGAHFQAYDVSYNRKEGIPVFSIKSVGGKNLNKINDYFEGIPNDIDATLMLKNHVYITKGQYYYDFEVELDQEPYNKPGDGNEPIQRKLAFGSRKRKNGTETSHGLFATQQRCGYSDDMMGKIRTRFVEAEARNPADGRGVGQLIHMSRDSEKSQSDYSQRTALLACLIGIVGIVGLIAVGFTAYKLKAARDKRYAEELTQ